MFSPSVLAALTAVLSSSNSNATLQYFVSTTDSAPLPPMHQSLTTHPRYDYEVCDYSPALDLTLPPTPH
ncbi:hypothetical protein L2E82_44936 [Cichorium intybus]|uniref:Uncharacterized protein n=1 Tax=Cichorium intybus TaxID=13427 RepID=A0ACB8ZRL5_CICIN|nr:hypothetical protein L2E82_44936 [Cichorium intybus]